MSDALPAEILGAWQALRTVAEQRGRPFVPIAPDELDRLRARIDVPADADAWLQEGTPVDPFEVGGRTLLPRWADVVEWLAAWPRWPRTWLPIGRSGDRVVFVDLETARVQSVDPLELGSAYPGARPAVDPLALDPRPIFEDLRTWLACVEPDDAIRVRAWHGLRRRAWAALEARLGPGWNERWLFQDLQPVSTVRATLASARRVAARTRRVTAAVVLLAPWIGWFAGSQLEPPAPWAGLVVAVFVLGGVPGWLLAHASAEARDLARILERLPPD